MNENNWSWLLENVKLLIDENLGLRLKGNLKRKGFKHIKNVQKGVSDGVVFRRAKKSNQILLTADKRLYKTAMKYLDYSIYIPKKKNWETRILRYVSQRMMDDYKLIRKKYEVLIK